MSYYYSYYLGYEKDGLLYPLGPYDCEGKLCSVLTRSRSFASNLHELFDPVSSSIASEEFRKRFENEDYKGERGYAGVSYLPVGDLPCGDLITRGYCLIRDIQYYLDPEGDGDLDMLKYHMLTPEQFSFKASTRFRHDSRQADKPPKIELAASYRSPLAFAKLTVAFPETNPAKAISVQNEIKLDGDFLGCNFVFAFKKTKTKNFQPNYAHLNASLKF